ncbi:MAG: response regulator [Elsteraceae bacterium]
MKPLVLVVDDEPDVEPLYTQLFRRDLRSGRFSMVFVSSGSEALARLSEPQRVSLLLSDVNMPGMTGLELVPRVKALQPDLPVIMITAYGDSETRRRALECGAEGLLTKPVDFEALRGEINTRLATLI